MESAGVIQRPDANAMTLPSARVWGGKRGHNHVVAQEGSIIFEGRHFTISNDGDKTYIYYGIHT